MQRARSGDLEGAAAFTLGQSVTRRQLIGRLSRRRPRGTRDRCPPGDRHTARENIRSVKAEPSGESMAAVVQQAPQQASRPRSGRRRSGGGSWSPSTKESSSCFPSASPTLRRVSHRGVRWSRPRSIRAMDYVLDALMDGTRLRAFNVVDDFTRECLAIEVDTSIPGLRATRVMERIVANRPSPEFIICDNGPEFTGSAFDPGHTAVAFASTSSGLANPSRTPTPRASTESFATSSSTRTGSSPWTTQGRGSRRGGSTTTRSGRTRDWTTSRRKSLLYVTFRLNPERHRTGGQVRAALRVKALQHHRGGLQD